MYSAFSEAARRALFFIAKSCFTLAHSEFKYYHVFYDKNINLYMVNYAIEGNKFSEPCDIFIQSSYPITLSHKELKKIFNGAVENKLKNKMYEVSLFDESLNIFTVKNKVTNFCSEKLLLDIIADSQLLENLNAESIKCIINHAMKFYRLDCHASFAEDQEIIESDTHDRNHLKLIK